MKKTKTQKTKTQTDVDDAFHIGICVALAVIYDAGAEGIAEELIGCCGAGNLLRVARKNAEPCRADLIKTVRQMRMDERWRKTMARKRMEAAS
jgi:hypothetical protein